MSAPASDTSIMSNAEEPDNDSELSALMNSALEDLRKQTNVRQRPVATNGPVPASATVSSSPSQNGNNSDNKDTSRTAKKNSSKKKNTADPAFDPSMMREVDDIFKNMMTQDPHLKEHWERLAESCTRAAESGSEEDFEKSLQDTLRKMSDNVQSLPSRSDIPEEELAKIWSNLGMNPDGGAANGLLPDIMPFVTNMMQNLLSKDILYPALKDLTDKYPAWLQQNGGKLSDEDRSRFEKQLDLMREVCNEFEAESPDDSDATKKERFQRILTTMQAMQECGSPPKDLVGDVPDMGSPELDFSKIPGFNPTGSQCSIQ